MQQPTKLLLIPYSPVLLLFLYIRWRSQLPSVSVSCKKQALHKAPALVTGDTSLWLHHPLPLLAIQRALCPPRLAPWALRRRDQHALWDIIILHLNNSTLAKHKLWGLRHLDQQMLWRGPVCIIRLQTMLDQSPRGKGLNSPMSKERRCKHMLSRPGGPLWASVRRP